MQTDVRDNLAGMEKANQERRQLLADLQTQLASEGLDVAIDAANGVLRLTENAVKFDANRADLSDRARLNVGKIARVLERVLPRYAACKVTVERPACGPRGAGPTVETVFIEGHTDTTGVPDPKERDRRNWELSAERAVATYREIVSQSPILRQLRTLHGEELMSVSGYSSTRPIDTHETREAWEKNRRIDLRFVMEVDTAEGLRQILALTNAMKSEIDHLVDASAPPPVPVTPAPGPAAASPVPPIPVPVPPAPVPSVAAPKGPAEPRAIVPRSQPQAD